MGDLWSSQGGCRKSGMGREESPTLSLFTESPSQWLHYIFHKLILTEAWRIWRPQDHEIQSASAKGQQNRSWAVTCRCTSKRCQPQPGTKMKTSGPWLRAESSVRFWKKSHPGMGCVRKAKSLPTFGSYIGGIYFVPDSLSRISCSWAVFQCGSILVGIALLISFCPLDKYDL